MRLSRRSFIKRTGTLMVCICVGGLGTSSCAGTGASGTSPAPPGSYRLQDGRVYVTLSQLGALLDVGGAVKLTLEHEGGSERKIILVRPGEADYRAFANACTHNGKELIYLHEEGLLACSGRASRFDLIGGVDHGPAEDVLPNYRVEHADGELVIAI